MANLILSVTFIGLILNFLGTVILVFSLPAYFKQTESGGLAVPKEGIVFSSEPERVPARMVGTYDSLKSVLDLFRERVISDKDPSIILALVFLGLSTILQGYGVWLSVTDC